MIYTASYFEPSHHGKLIAISRSIPKGFKVQKQLKFLAPSSDLLQDWQQGQIDEAGYIQGYRGQIAASWKEVKQWLDSLNSKQDMTLLCWEKKGDFCHRNLVAKLVQKYRPDCFGGCDVQRVKLPACPHCSTELYPGLGFSYCPACKSWIKTSTLEAAK